VTTNAQRTTASGRLAGKRAVVVGAGQTRGVSVGIGRATALLFAREGATVLLVDRDEQSVNETRSMIEAEGGSATVHLADVRREDACRALASAAEAELGAIDVLYDGVGRQGMGQPDKATADLWDAVMELNLKSMWLVAKHAVPLMRRQRSGSIVLVSSISAVRGSAATPYGVSKAGVNRLAIALASAYAEFDIRANAIMPGLMDTPMAIDATLQERGMSREQLIAERQATVPMSYVGTAWDVAYAALYLASDEARYVSGQCIAVDGGRTVS
jgi:NAD(P)-dependent dehydrogenase (short-subunit alcohol dehydrogenase family)